MLWSIIGLLAIITLIIMFAPNLNDYKLQIAELVEKATGRTLQIDGDINLSFYPWLGLNLGKTSIGNAASFPQSEFAKVEQTQVRVRLIPLLVKHVEVDTVLLDNVQINLTRQPDGSTNWDDLLALGEDEVAAEEESTILKKLKVKGLDLRHAKIVFDDQQLGTRYALSDINLNTSALEWNQPVTVDFKATMDISGATNLTGQISSNTQVTFKQESQQYWLEPLQISAVVQGDTIPGGKQTLTVSTKLIEVDLNQQTVAINGIVANIMEAVLTSEVQIRNFLTNPTLSGNIKLADLYIPKISRELGLPALPKKNLFKMLGLQAQFKASLAGASLQDFQLLVDDNNLTIPQLIVDFNQETLHLEKFALQALGMNLNGKLDINQLFSQPTAHIDLGLAPFNPQNVLKHLDAAQLQLSPPFSLTHAALQTSIDVTPKAMKINGLHIEVDEHQFNSKLIEFDFTQDTLTSDKLTLNGLGMTLNGDLFVQHVSTQPQIQSSLKLPAFSPRKLLQRLGQTVPTTADPTVLKTASMQTRLQGNLAQLNLESLKIRLDNSILQGKVGIQNFQQPAITFQLDLDSIDVDRYLPPSSAKVKSPKFTPPAVANGEPLIFPIDMLRALNLNGTLKVGQLTAADVKVSNIYLGISARQGQIKLTPQAMLYDGIYQGNLRLNAQSQPPLVYLEQKLTEVQAKPLFTALFGYDKIIGTANLDTQFTSKVSNLKHLLLNLTGTIRFEFLNGAIQGFNIAHSLRQAKALLQAKSIQSNKSVRTRFSSLQGTFTAKNGILYNNNLSLKAPLLRLNGGGQMNMSSKEMFFSLNAVVWRDSLNEPTGINIPIEITGNWNTPIIHPNLTALKATLLKNLFRKLIEP
jgi:AsmA protein